MESGVLTTTEMACALVAEDIVSSYGDINIYTGTDNDDKAAPAVICYAESASEDFPFSGIWHVKTNIILKEMAELDSERVTRLNSLLGDVHSAFLKPNIESTLTSKSPSNYYVYQVVFDGKNSTQDGDAWVHTLSLDIVSTTKAS